MEIDCRLIDGDIERTQQLISNTRHLLRERMELNILHPEPLPQATV